MSRCTNRQRGSTSTSHGRARACHAAVDADALVVFGGEQAATDDHTHPYLPDLARLMADYTAMDRPVLGICLGSQLLARAFGGENHLGIAPEFGWVDVALTEAGRADPVLSAVPDRFPIFQWHSDTFTLPPDAVGPQSHTARHRAFRIGRATYGTQFHFEASAPSSAAGPRPSRKSPTACPPAGPAATRSLPPPSGRKPMPTASPRPRLGRADLIPKDHKPFTFAQNIPAGGISEPGCAPFAHRGKTKNLRQLGERPPRKIRGRSSAQPFRRIAGSSPSPTTEKASPGQNQMPPASSGAVESAASGR